MKNQKKVQETKPEFHFIVEVKEKTTGNIVGSTMVESEAVAKRMRYFLYRMFKRLNLNDKYAFLHSDVSELKSKELKAAVKENNLQIDQKEEVSESSIITKQPTRPWKKKIEAIQGGRSNKIDISGLDASAIVNAIAKAIESAQLNQKHPMKKQA